MKATDKNKIVILLKDASDLIAKQNEFIKNSIPISKLEELIALDKLLTPHDLQKLIDETKEFCNHG